MFTYVVTWGSPLQLQGLCVGKGLFVESVIGLPALCLKLNSDVESITGRNMSDRWYH